MNIRCPSCQTVFRVDPAKVPAEGVRAKCSRCAYAFRIAPPGEPAAAPPATIPRPTPPPAPPPAAPAQPGAGRAAAPTWGAPQPVPAAGTLRPPPAAPPRPGTGGHPPAATPVPPTRPAAPVTPPPAAARPAPAPQPPQAPAAEGPARTPVFGSRDPRARAQRIARALVSDIVAYHKKRVEETLASGRIRTEFRDEIMKSWDEYVAQVGIDMAKGTPFFRDALNEILARGQRVF